MIRRFNYTDRKKIPRELIRITLIHVPAGREFDATLRLAKLGLPADARVFVEAYHKSDYMRFDFGTVGTQRLPLDRRLTGFYTGARILFRVKIVAAEESAGKLLAEADQIRPASAEDGGQNDPLLPVRTVGSMGDQIWRVTWNGGPVLELNNKESEIMALLTADPRFKTLILPEVLRSILVRVLAEPMDGDSESEQGRLAARWLEFAESLYPVDPPETSDRDYSTIETWVNEVVASFCRRNQVLELWRGSLRVKQEALSI